MKELLYIFVGGGIGSTLRYIASLLWQHLRLHPAYSDIIFPWPTLIVNIVGCLLIGLFYAHSASWHLKPETTLMLTTGLCGGLPTFSTFSYESITLLRTGHTTLFIIYISTSIILGLAAVLAPILLTSIR